MSTTFPTFAAFDAQPMRINYRQSMRYDGNFGRSPKHTQTRISTILQINGRHFHYEAIQVAGPEDTHTAVNPDLQSTLDALITLAGAEAEDFETIEVDGRTYVEFIEPFLK